MTTAAPVAATAVGATPRRISVLRAVVELRRLAFVGLWRRPVDAARRAALVVVVGGAAIVAAVELGTAVGTDLAVRSVLIGTTVTALSVFLPAAAEREDPHHPRGFAGFGLPRRPLIAALLVTDALSASAVPLAIVLLGWVVGWARAGDGGVALVLAVLLFAALLQVIRLSTSLGVRLWAREGGRGPRAVAAALLVASLIPVVLPLFVADRLDWSVRLLRDAGIGALWSAPGAAPASGWTIVLGTFACVVVLAAIEAAVVLAQLKGPRPRRLRPSVERIGIFRIAGTSPTLGVAARSLVYWARDPRYGGSALVLPFVPVLMVAAAVIGGVPGQIIALVPVPVFVLLLGWSTTHNDVAYDSTAVWSHVVSPIRGVQDRIGRAVPPLLLGAVVVVVGAPLTGWIAGRPGMTLVVFGLSVAALLSSVGVGSAVSARFPYAVPSPGSSAFRSPQNPGSAGGAVQTLTVAAVLLLVAPAAVLAAMWILHGGQWSWWALGVGSLVGLAALIIGVAIGGVAYDRRGPELVAFAVRN